MNKLLFMSARSISPVGVAAGVLSTIAVKKFGRPLLVEVLKLGYEAKDSTEKMLNDARELADEARTEARSKASSKSGSK